MIGPDSEPISSLFSVPDPDSAESDLDKPAAPTGRRLDRRYYLHNFQRLTEHVWSVYGDILPAATQHRYEAYAELSDDAKCLFLRLESRVGVYFLCDDLAYSEILDIAAAVRELENSQFAVKNPEIDTTEHLSKLTVKRTRVLAKQLNIKLPSNLSRKQDQQQFLLDNAESSELLAQLQSQFPCLELTNFAWIEVFKLCFFGNSHQQLNEFVLSDLGIIDYESVRLDKSNRLFQSAESIALSLQILQFRRLIEMELDYGDTTHVFDHCDELQSLITNTDVTLHSLILNKVNKSFNRAARQLEREKRLEEAVRYYESSGLPPARERLARVYGNQSRFHECLKTCLSIIEDPHDETEVVFIEKAVQRFINKAKRTNKNNVELKSLITAIEAARNADVADIPRYLLLLNQTQDRVEEQARQAFAGDEVYAMHSENSLWRVLYGLCFWDIVFAPIPGAFLQPFQIAPLDLKSSEFYLRRQELTDSRIEQIQQAGSLWEILEQTVLQKCGKANPFVPWRYLDVDGLRQVAETIDVQQVAVILKRIATRPTLYLRGLPDLMLLNRETGAIKLYEVKGPGDQVRPEQTAWLRYMQRHGIESGLVYVEWL